MEEDDLSDDVVEAPDVFEVRFEVFDVDVWVFAVWLVDVSNPDIDFELEIFRPVELEEALCDPEEPWRLFCDEIKELEARCAVEVEEEPCSVDLVFEELRSVC